METQIFLAITFVFGVLYLLTCLKIFRISLSTFFQVLIPHKEGTVFGGILNLFGIWFFYISLIYQAWYWLFKDVVLN